MSARVAASRVLDGPYRPLTTPCLRCDAARHFRLSLRVHKQARGELTQRGQCELSRHAHQWRLSLAQIAVYVYS